MSERNRCSCAVAANSMRRMPASKEATWVIHSSFGAPELVRPPPLSRQGTGDLEDPARGHPLHVAAQVPARDTQDLVTGTGQRGQKLAVLALDAVGPQGQLVTGGAALVIGQERVVPGR